MGRAALLLVVIFSWAVPVQSAARYFPHALTHFSSYQDGQPVFTAVERGWDEELRERGWVIKDGDVYKLWYSARRKGSDEPFQLGYATSADGYHWQRFAGNPVFDEGWIEDIMVLKQGGRYYMFAEGAGDRAQLLLSDDGIRWQSQGVLDIRKVNGQPISRGHYGTPTVWYEKGSWWLFYERDDQGIWLARSTDLRVWRNIQDEAIITTGPENYDAELIALNQIIKIAGRYYALMHGSGSGRPRQWNIILAVSDDLVHWQKYSGNPLIDSDNNDSSGILVNDGQRLRLYTMHEKVRVYLSPLIGRLESQ